MKRLLPCLLVCFFTYRAESVFSSIRPPELSGYIEYSAYVDSRAVVGLSDNYTLLYPQPKKYDPFGVDLHHRGQFDMVSLASLARLTLFAPEMRNWQVRGIFEVDINGRDFVLHLARIRHAFIECMYEDWIEFIAGHTWHPFYQPPHVPFVVANNSGQPFEAYSRNPQLRATFFTHDSAIVCALLSQIDFASDGPEGPNSVYLRNSMVPELHLQFQQMFKEHWFAIAVDFKRIVPRLKTNEGIAVVEHVNALMVGIMADIVIKKANLKTRLVYGENASEFLLIGGYAVDSITQDSDYRTYTPLRSIAWWAELSYACTDRLTSALFVGFARNLGSRHAILTDLTNQSGTVIEKRVFGFATAVQQLARISPRVRYRVNALEIAAEIEYTRAWHGTLADTGKVIDSTGVGVARFMLATCYYF